MFKSSRSPPDNSFPCSFLFSPPTFPSSWPDGLVAKVPSIRPAAPGPGGSTPYDPDRGSRRILAAAAADPWILEAAGSSSVSCKASNPTPNSLHPHLRPNSTRPSTFLLVAKLLPLTKHRRSAQRELLALSLLSCFTTSCQATLSVLSPGQSLTRALQQPSPQHQGLPTNNPSPQFLSFLQCLPAKASLHQPPWRNSQTE